MTPKAFVLLQDRGLLAVLGADSRSFLQGLVSNDIEKVGPGRAIYANLLTPQGKFLHDFFIAEFAPDDEATVLVLDCELERLADLERRLALYRLRASVVLADLSASHAVTALIGEDAVAGLGLAAEPGLAAPCAGGIAYVDPRLAAMGARAVLRRQDAPVALAALGFAAEYQAAYDRHRLAHGLPDGSRDMIVEKSFPLECGVEELNGIDYDKGCYIGQELTARTHYRGTIRKRLLRVDVEGPLPAPGTPVMLGGKEAGEMRSGRDGQAIALLRIELLGATAEEAGGFTAGGARIVPVKPDWARF